MVKCKSNNTVLFSTSNEYRTRLLVFLVLCKIVWETSSSSTTLSDENRKAKIIIRKRKSIRDCNSEPWWEPIIFTKEYSKDSEDNPKIKMKTLWVIGGPGCGKGTQCDKIIEKYGFIHLSSGDLLREEVASGSPRGAELQELMSKGLFVPTEIVLELIKERMKKAKEENPSAKGFLIDGYPREKDQGIQFEKDVCPVDLILFFDVANETLQKRLLGRAAAATTQRADDNAETIKKRIEIFNQKNGEIVSHFKNKVVQINAEGAVDVVFVQVTKALDELLAA